MSLAVPEPQPVAVVSATSAPDSLTAWAQAATAAHRIAAPLIHTDFVPQHFRPKNPRDEESVETARYAATAAVLTGAELGLSPMQSLQGIYVIGGKPALYARMMLAVTLSHGHEVWTIESTDAKAVLNGRRRGSSHTEQVTVTMDMARKAGWVKNTKYQTEPATMLLARAQSQMCRRIAPDALAGIAASVEELEDENLPTVTIARTTAEPVKRTAKRTTAPTPPEPDLGPPAAELTPEPETGELITEAQSRKMHALLRETGHADREIGLAYMADTLGREVTTSKDLTKDEASRVIEALQQEPLAGTTDDTWPTPAQPPLDAA